VSGTAWKFISIVAIGLTGLIFFMVMHTRLRGQKIDLRNLWAQNSARFASLLGGAYLMFTGLIFHSLSSFWWDILRSFLVVTGLQIFLSATGIRMELLGNNPPEVERADQEASELKSKPT
jgi:hypothetical protein